MVHSPCAATMETTQRMVYKKRTPRANHPRLPGLPKVRAGPGNTPHKTDASDPVNIANGNVVRDETDFLLPGIGLSLAFARHYDSQSTTDVGLGVGWVHSY